MADRGIQRLYLLNQKTVSTDHQIGQLDQLFELRWIAQEDSVIQIDHQPTAGLAKTLFHVDRCVVENFAVDEHDVETLQLCSQPMPPSHAALLVVDWDENPSRESNRTSAESCGRRRHDGLPIGNVE